MIRLSLLCTLLLLALSASIPAREAFGVHLRAPSYGKRGKLERKVNTTVAHRDHVHLGMTKRGAAARTSFWSRGR